MIRPCLLLMLLGTSLAYADNPPTMRVDFYHSGNAETEMFSLDRVVLEPLAFPGNLGQPIDQTLRGKYAFEIIDPASGDVAWSRSFSSIYGEWETTGEAREMNRTFHESLRFPLQEDEFRVVLKKRGAGNLFQTIWQLDIDPEDYLVHRETAAYADHVVAIELNGDPATKVDLLLLGDGYTADEQGEFIDKARELTEMLFATSPFRERRADFNVWALAPPARESGVSRPSTGVYRDSPVGATYDAFRSERYVLTNANNDWRRIASSAPYDFVEILTNSETYGGGGIYGLFSTAAANSEWAGYLFIHEFGHHFAGLADEYYTSSVAYEAPSEITEPYEPNVTALLDPENLKWKHLVAADTPLPTPWPKDEYEEHSLAYQAKRANMRAENVAESEMNKLFIDNQQIVEGMFSAAPHATAVGAFEGAIYQAKGYYRSEQNCIMFTRTEDFCRVCSAAIEAVIDEYTH
ncbi:MAG: M64 family metallopeptidase [Woeseiaceae bacterium]